MDIIKYTKEVFDNAIADLIGKTIRLQEYVVSSDTGNAMAVARESKNEEWIVDEVDAAPGGYYLILKSASHPIPRTYVITLYNTNMIHPKSFTWRWEITQYHNELGGPIIGITTITVL